MSLVDPTPTPNAADVPVAHDFKRRFLRDVHVLIAEGYTRLDSASLAASSEESISGQIVQRVNEWFSSHAAPEWTRAYFVTPELPVQREKREGKKRPRIDIYVESSQERPRARFAYESKRFYRSDSVAEYVGPGGLLAFLDGTHTVDGALVGMLGLVQRGSNEAVLAKVHKKLDDEREAHGLAEHGAVWTPVSFDPRIGTTWMSRHKRAAPRVAHPAPDAAVASDNAAPHDAVAGLGHGEPLDVYHTFLPCGVGVEEVSEGEAQPGSRAIEETSASASTVDQEPQGGSEGAVVPTSPSGPPAAAPPRPARRRGPKDNSAQCSLFDPPKGRPAR
jgi:hypothetical protein